MEQGEPRRIIFAVPRKGAGLALVIAALLFSLFTYYCRFIAPYWFGQLSNFGRAIAWLAIAFMLGIAVKIHCIVTRNFAVCLMLIGVCGIVLVLPVPRDPEKAWFLKHQAGYEQVLEILQSNQLSRYPDYEDSASLSVPDAYQYLQLELVRIEQDSPTLIEFRSRRFLASVYYAEELDPRFPEYLAGLFYDGKVQLAEHWWLVYTSTFP